MRFLGQDVPAEVYLGGDLPFLKSLLGITTAWQVPSIYTRRRWMGGALRGGWVGGDRMRTALSDAKVMGKLPVVAKGCGVTGPPLLVPEDRWHVVICILHLTMAFGRLLSGWLQEIFSDADRNDRRIVEQLLKNFQTGVKLTGSHACDGEETKRLFEAWQYIAPLCPPSVTHDQKSAITDLGRLLGRLYRTRQDRDPGLADDCAEVGQRVREHCFPDSKSSYLQLLEHDVPVLLRKIFPWGLAMYCQDTTETVNAKLKLFFESFTNRGGGEKKTQQDKELAALLQTFQYIFLYFYLYLLTHGKPRCCDCRNAHVMDADLGVAPRRVPAPAPDPDAPAVVVLPPLVP